MTVHYFTTPNGDEMAVLPRAELEELTDAAARAAEVAAYRDGRLPGLTADEALAFAEASSPLAFFRKRAGMKQDTLATHIGISQNYLSDIENGKREGTLVVWLKLAAALKVPVDMLVPEED